MYLKNHYFLKMLYLKSKRHKVAVQKKSEEPKAKEEFLEDQRDDGQAVSL